MLILSPRRDKRCDSGKLRELIYMQHILKAKSHRKIHLMKDLGIYTIKLKLGSNIKVGKVKFKQHWHKGSQGVLSR